MAPPAAARLQRLDTATKVGNLLSGLGQRQLQRLDAGRHPADGCGRLRAVEVISVVGDVVAVGD
ncbi:hypothetical protein [Streptomyces sp. NPDC101776]|uniref:hypothetical protein n=1 Tax=Streptomyces sp. NPDC101776 TaxID=3366146 RepID=UPI003801F845